MAWEKQLKSGTEDVYSQYDITDEEVACGGIISSSWDHTHK